jgi:hypothetical protein
MQFVAFKALMEIGKSAAGYSDCKAVVEGDATTSYEAWKDTEELETAAMRRLRGDAPIKNEAAEETEKPDTGNSDGDAVGQGDAPTKYHEAHSVDGDAVVCGELDSGTSHQDETEDSEESGTGGVDEPECSYEDFLSEAVREAVWAEIEAMHCPTTEGEFLNLVLERHPDIDESIGDEAELYQYQCHGLRALDEALREGRLRVGRGGQLFPVKRAAWR